MTVANGREFLSIPGPTNVPDAVLAAMQRPAIDIYSGDMLEMTRSLHEDLSKVFRTDSRVYIYAANGHVRMNGTSTFGGGCTQIVARTVEFSGNAGIGVDCSGSGVRDIRSSRLITLVE